MSSEAHATLVDKNSLVVEKYMNRTCPRENTKGKVPKRMHKAEREKLKREHLNELFLDLAGALELTEENSGKASILCEATRVLKDLLGEIECLKKENTTLLSESQYVTSEKNELREENAALENQVENLQSELEARVVQSKPDLNAPPPPEFQTPDLTTPFPVDCLSLPAVESSLPQAPAFFVLPIPPDPQAYPSPEVSHMTCKPNSNVSKPHARYPTRADSWPSNLLGEQPTVRKESQLSNSNSSFCTGAEVDTGNI